MKKWINCNKALGLSLALAISAVSAGFVLEEVHNQKIKTIAVATLAYSFNFLDGGSSNNSAYANTGITTHVSYDSDNPGGTTGTTEWKADYANLSLSYETRLGGRRLSTLQTDNTTIWSNIKMMEYIDQPIEKVEIHGAKSFGTRSNLTNIYLQYTTGSPALGTTVWTTIGTTNSVTTTASILTFDTLNLPTNSYLRLGIELKAASSGNHGLAFTGIKVYKPAGSNPIKSLSYSGTLQNTTQYAGYSFDATGLTFTATLNDNTTQPVALSDISFSPDPLTAGTTSVTASCSLGGGMASTTVTGFNTVTPTFAYGTYPIAGTGPATAEPITPTGSVPSGSTATLTTSYSTVEHMTAGNYQLLEFNGYTNMILMEIKLSARSNVSSGAGKFEYSYNGVHWVSIVADAKFNTADWYGNWSNTYVDVVKPVDIPIGSAGKFFLKITASENSLYCESYTLKWRPKAMTDRTLTGITITTLPEVRRYIIGQTFNPLDMVVRATYDDMSVNNDFKDYYLSIPLGTMLETLGTNIPVTLTAASNTTITTSYTIIEVCNPDYLEIATPPTKNTYLVGETLDLTGLKVNTHAGTWGHLLDTDRYTTTPAAGAILKTPGTVTVTVKSSDVSTLTDTFTITVNQLTYTPSGADMIISEVYGGGGNSGATYSHDYVEIFNKTTLPIDLTGYSIQYGSPTSSTAFTQITTLSGTVPAKGYFLVRLSTNNSAVGTPLDTPDALGNINMGGTNGKVALVNGTTGITNPTDASVVDFVGYGSANAYEGTGAAAAISSTTSISRMMDPAIDEPIDTDDNSFDFIASSSLTPMNTQDSFYEQFMRLTLDGAICTAVDWGYIDDNYNALTATGQAYFASKADAVARHNYLVSVNSNLPALDSALLSLNPPLIILDSHMTITVIVISLAGVNLLAYFYLIRRKRKYLN
ncbi:MAG: lamin tail domain-containing protein [Bacilli bacterium]